MADDPLKAGNAALNARADELFRRQNVIDQILSDVQNELNWDPLTSDWTTRGSIDGFPTLQEGVQQIKTAGAALSGNGAAASGSTMANSGGAPSPNASAGTSISDYLVRGTVIVLGFIFVAVGLALFKNNTTIIETVKGIKP